MNLPGRALWLAAAFVCAAALSPRRCAGRRVAGRARASVAAEDVPDLGDLPEVGDDDTSIDDEMMAEDMAELFAEGLAAAGDTPGAKPKVSSLFDMNDIQFKMMMIKRLGKEDYNKIFGGIRVEREIL
ncbi:hypothetical protein M885DRAFT_550932 [Pelagophyceae sp. CCMP2097]|nr:hypothetical protein M885DRAFT_550932 [Pelagophyceae sp. CCMP2097]